MSTSQAKAAAAERLGRTVLLPIGVSGGCLMPVNVAGHVLAVVSLEAISHDRRQATYPA
jgi:hypothetical protein